MLNPAGGGAADGSASADHRCDRNKGFGPGHEAQERKRGLHLGGFCWGRWSVLLMDSLVTPGVTAIIFMVPTNSMHPRAPCSRSTCVVLDPRQERGREIFGMEITHSKGTLYPALQLASFRVRKVCFCCSARRCQAPKGESSLFLVGERDREIEARRRLESAVNGNCVCAV